jgi:hypothetical protein
MKTNNHDDYLWPFDVINMSQLRMEYAKKTLKKIKAMASKERLFIVRSKAATGWKMVNRPDGITWPTGQIPVKPVINQRKNGEFF